MKKLTPTNIFLFLSLLLNTLQNSGLVGTAATPAAGVPVMAPCPQPELLDAGQ